MTTWFSLPTKNREPELRLYIERGILPGAFLHALLANDLQAAIKHADHESRTKIPNWIEWMQKHLPNECWGSVENVRQWSEAKIDDHGRALVTIDAQIAHLEDELDKLQLERKRILSETTVHCQKTAAGRGCGASHKIKDLAYIATHHYVRPYSCTGGDYWMEGEGNFICPSCGHRNRLYDRPHIQQLKANFGKIIEEHE